jgi:hypothetical protein
MADTYRIQVEIETKTGPRIAVLEGRVAWALRQLTDAGTHGLTALECPALRWSGYVHRLRCAGFDIETQREPNAGPFRGTHARYMLHSRWSEIEREHSI